MEEIEGEKNKRERANRRVRGLKLGEETGKEIKRQEEMKVMMKEKTRFN